MQWRYAASGLRTAEVRALPPVEQGADDRPRNFMTAEYHRTQTRQSEKVNVLLASRQQNHAEGG